jgi:UDPglucose 6-dehydrogenase
MTFAKHRLCISIDALLSEGATLCAFDPEAMENVKKIYGNKINFVENQYHALENSDALLIATEWGAFRNPDFDRIKTTLKSPKIFDGRNLFDLYVWYGSSRFKY